MSQEVIDFHVHFPTNIYPKSKEEKQKQFIYQIDQLIEEMDISNTKIAVISSIEPMLRSSWSVLNNEKGKRYGGNETAFEAIKQSGGRLIGAFVPNCFQNAEVIKRDIQFFTEQYHFKVIKIHPWLGAFPANSKELYPVFEAATELELPILYHSGTIPFTTPAEMFDMAKRFPKVKVVMGHSGETELWHDVMALTKYADNLFIETSGQPNRIFLEQFVQRYGSERVLYGSDWLGTPGKMIFRQLEINEIRISEYDKNNILINNAKRLLKLK